MSGEPHRIQTTSPTRLRNLHLRKTEPGPTRVSAVAGLLRELVLTAVG